jgi:osmotically inducible protein OsmC
MKRSASAVWNGGLREGNGTVSSASGAISDLPMTFRTRFEDEPGTNPEELIAAAHASCYSMALSGKLNAAGLSPESIRTNADLTLEKTDAGFTITRIHLTTRGRVPGADDAGFRSAAEDAKATCPVSRVLNAEITLDAALE